ncbi:MAG: CDP-glycerol glycerophosphotransferase family protein [Bacteroidota bacterium]
MVFSEILLKIPYSFLWRISEIFRKDHLIAFYCHELLDYEIFRNVHQLLPEVKIIAKSRKLSKELNKKYGINCLIYPAFPDVVIMARHSLHLFPSPKIIKIGLRHGAYHFKNFISADKYNKFDLFFFTSISEVEQATKLGIKNAEYGGFPKCDTLFDEATKNAAFKLKQNLAYPDKPTILFSSTWDKSGIAGVHFWYDRLEEISKNNNVLVTLHPWVSKHIVEKIKNTKNVKLISNQEIYQYMLISDAFVADVSSIIAEFMLLRKPIFTFKIPIKGRLSEEIYELLEKYTIRIANFDELNSDVVRVLQDKTKNWDYEYCLNLFFSDNLGKHSQVMAQKIKDFLLTKGIKF